MDNYLFNLINGFAGRWPILDNIGILLGNNYFGYVLFFILFLLILKNRKMWLPIAIEAIIACGLARFGIIELIRLFVHKARPFVENNVNLLFPHGDEFSFPSGHTAFFIALATTIYFYNKKLGTFFFVGGLLIGTARVFAGVHWPLDILAGIVVGIFSAWIIHIIFKKLKKKYQGK